MTIPAIVDQLAQDLRYAVRSMANNRLFASMAVLSLALGIGANTAIYSFMEAILIRSLPVRDPQSLFVFNWRSKDFPAVAHGFSGSNHKDPKTGMTSGTFPYPAFDLFRGGAGICQAVFAFADAGRLNLIIDGRADIGHGEFVTGDYFTGLGLAPFAGRLPGGEDDRTSAPVAAVGYTFATSRFGAADKAVGQAIRINGKPFTIAGVTPPGFFGVNPATTFDLYLPMHSLALLQTRPVADSNARYTDANRYWVEIMGRLATGVTMAQAQAASAGPFHALIESTASTAKEKADLPALRLQPGATGLDALQRQYSRPLYVLVTLVGFILAIACANIANLLLARATARRREMAVRLSLGAGRARVMRQLLTESMLLALLGGTLGVGLADWGIRLLTLLIGSGRENFTLRAEINWHVLAVTLALSLATGVLFGLAPALQATRVDLARALKQTRAGDPGGRRFPLSEVLVSAQIALSLLLLIAAGLFLRTLVNLNAIELGFNRENLLLFTVDARQAGYRDQALARFYDNLRARLGAIPGVRAVSLSSLRLVSGSNSVTGAYVPGAPPVDNNDTAVVAIGASFFGAMQIPILLGRDIVERDQASAAKVAVVNEVFARKYFGESNPLGQHIGLDNKTADIEIVGVSRAVRHNSLKKDIPPVAYYPYGQDAGSLFGMNFEVRAAGAPLALVETVRKVVREADARIPISEVDTESRQIDGTIGQERTFATLCSAFAALAILIACIGLYGTMAYGVERRTGEIGVRMALGAERGRVVGMVLRDVVVLAAAGVAIGLPVAWSASHVVESFLFGMKANDPLVLAAAPLALFAAALAAGYGPARRASRIDPWVALRHE